MKRFWKILLIVGALLVMSFTVASATCERPPQPPTCESQGLITVIPARWVEPVTHQEWVEPVTHEECEDVIDVPEHTIYTGDTGEQVFGDWGNWSRWGKHNYCSQSAENAQLCKDESKSVWSWCSWSWHTKYRRAYRTSEVVHTCPAGYTYNEIEGPNDCYKVIPATYKEVCETVVDVEGYWETIVDAEGYWIDPVCRPAVEGCKDPEALNYNPDADIDNREMCEYYVPCDETLPRVKENKIGWHDNGAPFDYGDWVEQPDGSFARNYLQPQTKSWDWITYDAVLEGGICLTDPQVRNRNAQELEYDKACSEGNVTVLPKVYADPQNNGNPVWQDWVNPLNGTSHRYGVQYFNSAWTQTSVDTRDGETVCAFEKGVDEGELELYEEKCSSRWTGRYMQTYQRTVRGHWVTWCNYRVPMEADLNGNGKVDAIEARKWEWSAGYLAGACALDCETQDWQGKLVDTFKEFKDTCGDVHVIGTLFGGNHFDNSCEIFDFCGWQESLLEQ